MRMCDRGVQMLVTTVGAFAAFSLMTIAVGTDYWLYSRGVCRTKSMSDNDTSRKNEEVMTHSGLWRTCCLEGTDPRGPKTSGEGLHRGTPHPRSGPPASGASPGHPSIPRPGGPAALSVAFRTRPRALAVAPRWNLTGGAPSGARGRGQRLCGLSPCWELALAAADALCPPGELRAEGPQVPLLIRNGSERPAAAAPVRGSAGTASLSPGENPRHPAFPSASPGASPFPLLLPHRSSSLGATAGQCHSRAVPQPGSAPRPSSRLPGLAASPRCFPPAAAPAWRGPSSCRPPAAQATIWGSFAPKLLAEAFLSTHMLWLKMSFNRARCWYLRSKKWPMASPRALTLAVSGSRGCPVCSGHPGPLSCRALAVGACPRPGGAPPVVGAGEPRRRAAPPRWKVLGESRPRMQKYPVCSWCSVLNPVKSVGAFLLIQRGFGSCSNSIINNLR